MEIFTEDGASLIQVISLTLSFFWPSVASYLALFYLYPYTNSGDSIKWEIYLRS